MFGKRKLKAEVVRLTYRVAELEERLCPCEQHDWKQTGVDYEYDGVCGCDSVYLYISLNLKEVTAMAEYVKKEDVLALADWYEEYDSATGEEYAFKYIDPLAVSNIPAADVVEVVRCVDCSYSLEDGFWCMGCGLMPGHATLPNKWCDEGERYYSGVRMDGEK